MTLKILLQNIILSIIYDYVVNINLYLNNYLLYLNNYLFNINFKLFKFI